MARKIRDGEVTVGLVGCGGVVTDLHLPTLVSIPGVTIKWVCDSSLERARQVSRNWNVRHAFARIEDCPDVDAVLVATPVGTRREIVAKTTERGWHALCEKPFAPSTIEHRDMLESAGHHGLRLGAGYMRRYYWAVQQARKMLSEKMFGPLIDIAASESAQLDRTGLDQSSYRNNIRASGGGVLVETGCHLLDEVMFTCGAKRAEIQACEQKIWNDYEVETVASGSIVLQSGEKVALQFTVSGVRPVYQGIAFRCAFGEIRLRLDPSKGLELIIGQGQPSPLELQHPHPDRKHLPGAIRSEWLHFLEAVRGKGDWDQQQETGLLTTDVIMQCGALAKNPSFLVKQ